MWWVAPLLEHQTEPSWRIRCRERTPSRHCTYIANFRLAHYLPSSITTPRSLSAFPITLTELSAIAAAAIMGDSRMPKTG